MLLAVGRMKPAMAAAALLPVLSLGGCSGAPSWTIAGAFFPAWLACAVLGTGAAIAARAILVASGLSAVLPYQTLVCLSVGLGLGSVAWLSWAGP